ncbi:Mediator of RNA polymerase II transcription subunit 31 [Clydaea vesicula]|uniref:Mediator of RNA polymerase II transcription subunit 31 n=1 Tax=Clydaea vesicula TaxID=447962 RepID=A0AAD5U4L3_9FUNG|nr:Mediator of RNA polymerase II transcription subunit 31 [Clydaea vesicula]
MDSKVVDGALNASLSESEERSRLRFQLELEFVQCLANPLYLQCVYPICLEILDLLQNPSFREATASSEIATFIHHKEFFHWQHRRVFTGVKDNNDLKIKKEVENFDIGNSTKSENSGESVKVEDAEQIDELNMGDLVFKILNIK